MTHKYTTLFAYVRFLQSRPKDAKYNTTDEDRLSVCVSGVTTSVSLCERHIVNFLDPFQ